MRSAPRSGGRGFGYQEDRSQGYRFEVRPRSDGGVIIVEVFAARDSEDARATGAPREKGRLDARRWGLIQQAVAAEFNHRLRQDGLRAGRWLKNATPLAPHLGKELVLLVWAIDDQDPALVPRMLANWRGLAPEERWWFYTTINATARTHAQDNARGWRAAIKIAFLDEPRDIGLESLRAASEPVRSAVEKKPREKKPKVPATQGRLFAEPDEPDTP